MAAGGDRYMRDRDKRKMGFAFLKNKGTGEYEFLDPWDTSNPFNKFQTARPPPSPVFAQLLGQTYPT